MKLKRYFYLSVAIMLSLSSCSEDDNLENDFKPTTYDVLGKVEKGPFVSGSTITIQPMDGNLQVLGSLYSSTIQDDLGNFSFGSKLFEAPYAELTANGYFFNEVDGDLSSGTLNLRALVDLSDETTVNVNLLTHLKYQRIQRLIANGMKFGEANKQAQKELFTAFGLQKYAEKDASTFSIAGGTDESAALIAISSLLLVDRSEAALTEYLAKLCREFGENGIFSESTQKQIDADKETLGNQISSVEDNIIERYADLGLEITVKNLAYFLDWDNDGIAGNEILQEGEEVKLEMTELNVPNEGGTYTISISSPIPVYLEPKANSDNPPIDAISPEEFFTEIYENISNADISMEKSLTDGKLVIKLSPLNSKTAKSTSVTIYDVLGNALGSVKIVQEGDGDISLPKLGKTGKQLVASMAMDIAQSFSELNLIEQYYHYNKEANLVSQYIYPSCSSVNSIWSNFYKANRTIMMFKEKEAEQLGVYQEYFNVFSAMQYYNKVVMWGDVPYINFVPDMNAAFNISRTPQKDIFADLKSNLEKAISYLEEKKNESLSNDANDFFFISKDVARILLANIYMYQAEYGLAEKLLSDIISTGFYELDSSNYNDKETITGLWNNGSGKETIFATRSESGEPRTRGNITITTPALVPIMTYTDVILSYAECLYKNGKISESEKELEKVTSNKGINVSGSSVLEKIKDARSQLMLYSNTNFAFMKRNGFVKDFYGVEDYRQLLPIPQRELDLCPQMTQNPGYC